MKIVAGHELSTRIRNCLKKDGHDISRPETIAALERGDILRIPDMGEKSAKELRLWLLKKGFDFKNHPPGPVGRLPAPVRLPMWCGGCGHQWTTEIATPIHLRAFIKELGGLKKCPNCGVSCVHCIFMGKKSPFNKTHKE